MNRTTPTAPSISAEVQVAPPEEQRWMSVVFLQGDDADTVLDIIDRDGADTAIHHLSQWDFGDETRDAALINGYVYAEIPQSPTDRVVRDIATGYALAYNEHFGYVSLLRPFAPAPDDTPKPVAPPQWSGPERQRAARRTKGLRL